MTIREKKKIIVMITKLIPHVPIDQIALVLETVAIFHWRSFGSLETIQTMQGENIAPANSVDFWLQPNEMELKNDSITHEKWERPLVDYLLNCASTTDLDYVARFIQSIATALRQEWALLKMCSNSKITPWKDVVLKSNSHV